MFSIAFICTANMCRSVMGHAICVPEIARRGWEVEVLSGGTVDFSGAPPARATWFTCCQNNTPPRKEGSTFVRDLPLASIDRFFVMEQRHAEVLIRDYQVPPDRVSLLGTFDPESPEPEIEDPIGRGKAEFDRCYARIRRCVLHYLETTAEIPKPTDPVA